MKTGHGHGTRATGTGTGHRDREHPRENRHHFARGDPSGSTTRMIELHTWTTPNGYKPIVMLEEIAMPYRIVPVDLGKREQKGPEHLKVNPNGKIPAIVDLDADGGPLRVFESGAILIYLAEKSGKLLPAKGAARAETLAWLMFQMAGVGPMFGQYVQFKSADPPNPAAAGSST